MCDCNVHEVCWIYSLGDPSTVAIVLIQHREEQNFVQLYFELDVKGDMMAHSLSPVQFLVSLLRLPARLPVDAKLIFCHS